MGGGASGARQPFSRATFTPSSDASPAVGPSSARPSGKPASTRSASIHEVSVAPRGDLTVSPEDSAASRSSTFSGFMLSKNSQLTISTGAKSQAALHSMRSSEIAPSAVVSPS